MKKANGALASHCILGKKPILVECHGRIIIAGCDYQVAVPLGSGFEVTEDRFVVFSRKREGDDCLCVNPVTAIEPAFT